MSDQTTITVTRAGGHVMLTVYPYADDPLRIELLPRRAALIGLDLLNLACEPTFTLEAQRDPAGCGARPVDPAGG
jgi:hypothetical protein